MCFPPPGTSHLEVLTCIIIYHHKTMRVNKWYNTTLRMCESMRGRRRALFSGLFRQPAVGGAGTPGPPGVLRWHILLSTTTLSINLLKDHIRLGLGLGLGLGAVHRSRCGVLRVHPRERCAPPGRNPRRSLTICLGLLKKETAPTIGGGTAGRSRGEERRKEGGLIRVETRRIAAAEACQWQWLHHGYVRPPSGGSAQ